MSASLFKKLNEEESAMAHPGSSLGIRCMKLKEKKIMSQDRTISSVSIKEMMDRETSIYDSVPVPLHSPDLTTYANLALYHYNYHAKTKYVLSKLLSAKVNGNFYALFDFTFEAEERGNPDRPAFRKFQAKVMREWVHYNLEVCLCLLKDDKKVASDRPKGKKKVASDRPKGKKMVASDRYVHPTHQPGCYCTAYGGYKEIGSP